MSSDATKAPDSKGEKKRASARAWLGRWWFVFILLVAVVELVLHVAQTRDAITDTDWELVKDAVQEQTQPADLIAIAPRWVAPLGRMELGDALMTTERVARADESRFPNATVVSYGGARIPALGSWSIESESTLGPFVVRRLANPDYRAVIEDLVALARAPSMTVSRSGPRPCPWRKGAPATGPLGFGPAAPAQRFHCDRGAWVAETIVADLDYAPRRCIYAPPPGGKASLRLQFKKVRFGARLEGHHALYVEAERDRKGTPVRISFASGDTAIGEATHEDGQGWIGFGFDTPDLAGTAGELTVDISSASGNRRMYCFEATTR